MRMRYILISLWVIDKTYQTYTVIAKLFLSFFYEQNMRGQLRKKNYLKNLNVDSTDESALPRIVSFKAIIFTEHQYKKG